jgi:hypothetical protein
MHRGASIYIYIYIFDLYRLGTVGTSFRVKGNSVLVQKYKINCDYRGGTVML